MKEWIMKHPILTFLMVAGIASELFDTIRAFAPGGELEPEPEAKNEEETK